MIRQTENTEQKRQNYVAAILHARNVKEPTAVEVPKYAKVIIVIALVAVLALTAGLLVKELRQPFALLSAGISPFAEQTHVADVQGLSPSKWVSTKTLSGEPVAVLLELQDNGIWTVTETKVLDSESR